MDSGEFMSTYYISAKRSGFLGDPAKLELAGLWSIDLVDYQVDDFAESDMLSVQLWNYKLMLLQKAHDSLLIWDPNNKIQIFSSNSKACQTVDRKSQMWIIFSPLLVFSLSCLALCVIIHIFVVDDKILDHCALHAISFLNFLFLILLSGLTSCITIM